MSIRIKVKFFFKFWSTGSVSCLSERYLLVSIHKWSFCPTSSLCSKNNPRNNKYMPVVIFFACLDLEQKSSFMDGH